MIIERIKHEVERTPPGIQVTGVVMSPETLTLLKTEATIQLRRASWGIHRAQFVRVTDLTSIEVVEHPEMPIWELLFAKQDILEVPAFFDHESFPDLEWTTTSGSTGTATTGEYLIPSWIFEPSVTTSATTSSKATGTFTPSENWAKTYSENLAKTLYRDSLSEMNKKLSARIRETEGWHRNQFSASNKKATAKR